MTKYQEDEFTVRDGRITLYRRADSPSKVYQCRFMADGKCIRRTTNEANRHDAASVAGEIYDEIKFKIRHNMPIGSKSFKAVWGEWKSSVSLSKDRRAYIKSIESRYILPFFGSQPITAVSTARVSAYWPWRELNTLNGNPSAGTLRMDAQLLRQFLKWAVARNFLSKLPEVKSPKQLDPKATRRPVFTQDDIQHFLDFSIYWVTKSVNAYHKTRRGLFFGYASLILYSGLRPKEARLLKWKDVELGENVLLSVSDEGKTGARVVVALPQAKDVLRHVRSLCGGKTGPDDYVFPGTRGGPVADYKDMFASLMTELGLNNPDRSNKTIYSLRHTYATFRLLYGKVDVFKLASNDRPTK